MLYLILGIVLMCVVTTRLIYTFALHFFSSMYMYIRKNLMACLIIAGYIFIVPGIWMLWLPVPEPPEAINIDREDISKDVLGFGACIGGIFAIWFYIGIPMYLILNGIAVYFR
jgi:hypothetical protein